MAPARKRGSSKAAAAAKAAAKKQLKIGDLVLAKMKGFPAWPAVVSDPTKWGYSADRKKVLVFFFGTKQIAFCNHVDIEAFTEERKKILLTKRQGKGADFVRAVDEIIDSYDKMQQDNKVSSADEGVVSDAGELDDSSNKCSTSSKNCIENKSDSKSQDCVGGTQGNNGSSFEENSVASIENESPHKLNTGIEQPTEKVSILDELRQTPLATNSSSRKRSRDVLSKTNTIDNRPSLRKSRCSAKTDPSKLEGAEVHLSRVKSFDASMPSMIVEEETAVSGKMSKKLLDSCNDVDVSVTDGTDKDTLPGVVAKESKTNHCNIDGTSQPTSKDEHLLESENVDVSGRVDDQMRVVSRKSRKPNKKQIAQGYVSMFEEAYSKVEVKTLSGSLQACCKMSEKVDKSDGDQHLPLVKRARARMGEPCVEEKQPDALGAAGDRSVNDDTVYRENSPAGSSVIACKDANSSLLNDCNKTKGRSVFSRVKSFHLMGNNADAEAALPPSKRLHRALEAMSANAAETSDDDKAIPSTSKTSVSVAPPVSNMSCTQMSNVQHANENQVLNLESSSPSNFASENQNEHVEALPSIKLSGASTSKHSPQEEDCVAVNDSTPSRTVKTDVAVKTPEPCLSESGEKVSNASCEPKKLLSEMDGKGEEIQLEQDCNDSMIKSKVVPALANNLVHHDGSISPVIPKSVKLQIENGSIDVTKVQGVSTQVCKFERDDRSRHLETSKLEGEPKEQSLCPPFSSNDTCLTLPVSSGSSAAGNFPGTKKLSSYTDDKFFGDRDMRQVITEVKHVHTPKSLVFSPEATPMKYFIAAAQARRLSSRSSSLSDNANDTKPSSDGMSISNPSPLFREDSSEHLSSHSGRIINQYSGRSPDFNAPEKILSHQEQINGSGTGSVLIDQQKALNKSYGHVQASSMLKSFEALMITLTRGKESISRATHHALECAKSGVAGEVVKIILQHLEKEPSMHRRVDLFFLVDSITRSCFSQKGSGDVYPSLFQTVLGRLASAAAPPGHSAWENRRQCLKVLRLWLERKTFPESIIKHHIRAIESLNEGPYANGFSRRPSRTERSMDDPVREMEGMLVDEYGSNANMHLPGLLSSNIFDEAEASGSDTDDKSFEAVTPEKDSEIHSDTGLTSTIATERHKHILEDVDGELEMEDVAPPETAVSSSRQAVESGTPCASHHQIDNHPLLPPPLPEEKPPTPPPLPSSPPPVARPACTSPSSIVVPVPSTSSTPDFAGPNPCMASNNLQNNLPHSNPRPVLQNNNYSDGAPYYAPGYRDHSNHMPPPPPPPASSFNSSCSYSHNTPLHPSINQGVNHIPSGCESLPNNGCPLQPPPPAVSNQFSYVQAEPQHQVQYWGHCASPSRNSFQYGHDQQVGSYYSERGGPPHHEGYSFAGAVPPGGHARERYSRQPESSVMPRQNWPHPPRPHSYHYPGPSSRTSEHHLRQTSGAPCYWRPQ